MKRFGLVLLNILLMMIIEIPLVYPQGAPMPFRIGGTVTIDGVQITQATDDGLVIRVTKPDGTNYSDVNSNIPEDKDGLNAGNWYTINIPIYKATTQPQGAKPGDSAIIHIYKNSQELRVTNPPNGQITIGGEGTSFQIDLTIVSIASLYTLTVTKSGTGSGTVKSSPTGINCGSDCSEAYNQGTSVTLTATPVTGSTFGGWSGACSGTGACTVTVDGAVTVTAEFALKTPDISVDQTSINFGDIKVGKKATKTLKITNGGSGDLWITLSGLEGTDFSIQGSSTVTIKSKKSYSLKVLVSPKSAGSKTATLRISSNDPDTPTIDISLKASWTGAIFIDVLSTYWAYDYIIAIYNAGITVGCVQDNPNTPENERRYCPEDSVTRGQIAVFIIRAKYRENFTYTTTPYFSDVPPTHTFFKYVQKLRDDGITVVNGTYGVNELVTRGGIAVFIIRAKYGENFTYTTTPYFTDVPPTHTFFKYVQKLKDDKITTVSGTYGVDQIVTRAGMAASLSRAFLGMQ